MGGSESVAGCCVIGAVEVVIPLVLVVRSAWQENNNLMKKKNFKELFLQNNAALSTGYRKQYASTNQNITYIRLLRYASDLLYLTW